MTVGSMRTKRKNERTERSANRALAKLRSPARSIEDEIALLQSELADARAKIARLMQMTEMDPLVNILNRRGLERHLRKVLSSVKRYRSSAAFMYIDLDSFKDINDAHGHAAGDAVLKMVAKVLATSTRASDTLARLGGDEFVVVLINLSEAEAIAKTRALEDIISSTYVEWFDHFLSVTASAGVTMISGEDRVAALFDRADAAMYRRKSQRQRAISDFKDFRPCES